MMEDKETEDIQVQIENKINEIRDEIGSRINPIFIAANKLSSNVRQALDLETDPGLLETPAFGDIICVHRIGFEHYGVYVGDNKVIHYDIDPSDHYKICVHQAPMEEFLNGSLVYSICEFPKETFYMRRMCILLLLVETLCVSLLDSFKLQCYLTPLLHYWSSVWVFCPLWKSSIIVLLFISPFSSINVCFMCRLFDLQRLNL